MKCDKCQNDIPDGVIVYTPTRNHWPVCETCAPTAWRPYVKPWERGYGEPAPCAYCGRPVAQKKYHSRYWPGRRFCNTACSTRFYYKRKSEPLGEISCRQCGETFQAKRADAQYCSVKCRVSAHRERFKHSA